MFYQSSKSGEPGAAHLDKRFQARAVLQVENHEHEIQDVATIGRAPGSSIVLSEQSVSRNHARIFNEGGHYWLKDLDSANGTSLNEKKIKLQMLTDGDKISFGEAKAVFHVSGVASGPALIGSDPLEGAEAAFEDGTPTGGLSGKFGTAEELRIRQLEHELEEAHRRLAAKDREIESLRQKGHAAQPVKEGIWSELVGVGREGVDPSRTVPVDSVADPLIRENERLQKLVRQLERALADSNMRIKNLQECLGG